MHYACPPVLHSLPNVRTFLVSRIDVLSAVLKAVKLSGALFYNAEYSEPWGTRSVDVCAVTSHLSPNSEDVIIFHLLTEGRGYALIEGNDRPLPLNAGEILIVPRGDAHILGNGRPVRPMDDAQVLKFYLKVSRSPAWAEAERSPNSSVAS